MPPLYLQLHTAEELRFFSDLAHLIEGILFFLVVFFVLMQIRQGRWGEIAAWVWPSLILAGGIFLPLFSFAHHFDELGLAWQAAVNIPQQRQHLIMAVLITMAGGAELFYLRSKGKTLLFRFVLPVVLLVIGLLFVTHPQHGTEEAILRVATIHRYLGSALILSGISRFLEIYFSKKVPCLKFLWIVFLFIAALFLISYREPAGAYEIDHQLYSQLED